MKRKSKGKNIDLATLNSRHHKNVCSFPGLQHGKLRRPTNKMANTKYGMIISRLSHGLKRDSKRYNFSQVGWNGGKQVVNLIYTTHHVS